MLHNDLVDEELNRLTETIAASGADIPALVAALRARQRRRDELEQQMTALAPAINARGDVPVATLTRQFRENLDDWQALLQVAAPQSRQLLRTIVRGRITVKPERRHEQRGWLIRGEGTSEPFLAHLSEDVSQALESPTTKSAVGPEVGGVLMAA